MSCVSISSGPFEFAVKVSKQVVKNFGALKKNSSFTENEILECFYTFKFNYIFGNELAQLTTSQYLVRKSYIRKVLECLQDTLTYTDFFARFKKEWEENLPEKDYGFQIDGSIPAVYSIDKFKSPNSDAFEFVSVHKVFVQLLEWLLPFDVEPLSLPVLAMEDRNFVVETWETNIKGCLRTFKQLKVGTYIPFIWGGKQNFTINTTIGFRSDQNQTSKKSVVYGFIKRKEEPAKLTFNGFELLEDIPPMFYEDLDFKRYKNQEMKIRKRYFQELVKRGYHLPHHSESEIIILIRNLSQVCLNLPGSNTTIDLGIGSLGLPFLILFEKMILYFGYENMSPSLKLTAVIKICKEFQQEYTSKKEIDHIAINKARERIIEVLKGENVKKVLGKNVEDVEEVYTSLYEDLEEEHIRMKYDIERMKAKEEETVQDQKKKIVIIQMKVEEGMDEDNLMKELVKIKESKKITSLEFGKYESFTQ